MTTTLLAAGAGAMLIGEVLILGAFVWYIFLDSVTEPVDRFLGVVFPTALVIHGVGVVAVVVGLVRLAWER